jgi:hypothetical protein
VKGGELVPQVQEVWNKLNPRERLTAIGALVVGLGWIIGLAGSFGLGGNTIALLGAIAVLVILFLKYSPNQNITWPAPIPLIVLGISAVVALLALIGLVQWLSYGGLSFFGAAIIAAIVTAVGAGLMAWGAWQEYSLTKPASAAPSSSMPPAAPPSAPSAPPAPPAPAGPTAQPPSVSDTDDLPPA